MPHPDQSDLASDRLTLGMLTAWLKGPTEIHLWHGVADRAQERDVNLICFSGGIPHWHQQYEAQKNILFDLAGEHNVNGLMVWANIFSHTLDREHLKVFCQHYAPLPMISMGMFLPSLPSIRIDMRDGMRKLLSHLIEIHGRRRIAFLRGLEVSQDAEDRYQAYCDTLAEHGLPLDSALVLPGDFRRSSGIAAVEQLIDIQHTSFDALVSANDNMAIGAMQALQSRGVRIPEDIVVAGFDDIEETRAIVPSLTTIRAPWYQLGSQSVDLVLSSLAGEPLPDEILLPTELVYRRSCGCQPLMGAESCNRSYGAHAALPIPVNSIGSFIHHPQAGLEAYLTEGLAAAISIPGLNETWTRQLVNDFLKDILSNEKASDHFLLTLRDGLDQIPSGAQIIEWQTVLEIFRSSPEELYPFPKAHLKALDLIARAYATIGEIAHRRQLAQRLDVENQTDRLNRIVQSMATTYDIDALMQLLAVELPGLGIQSYFLSLYAEQGNSPAWSRLILASSGKERRSLEPGGMRFPTRQLIPHEMLPKGRRFSFDVEALYFQGEQIGFVLFEIGPRDGDVYTTLRGHLSSALKSAKLVQVALEAEAKAVRADQLKTHLLANVSHELRAPINIILGLSQIALGSPNPYGVDLPTRLKQDLEYIYDSGEHLVRLINDLLDVSRAEVGELDLCFETVSPHKLLVETHDAFQKTSVSKQKGVDFSLEIPAHLPVLQADSTRLRQILMNLLSNAIKFTPQGRVVLGAEVQLPHIHFWVKDTGTGISVELQERIFEPFVKGDPPGQRRGGIGLGLNITRRLVALHGGSITLDSQLGQGSTFHVYLPLPGINATLAKKADSEGAPQGIFWISGNRTPIPPVLSLCQKSGLSLCWVTDLEDLEQTLAKHRPAALAWDLDHARPGDWSIVQRLRSYPQYCQLPLLLFQQDFPGNPLEASRVTNVLLKPAGKQTLQHVLDLLPQSLRRGIIWIVDDDPQSLKYYQELIGASLAEFQVRSVQGGTEALELLKEEAPDLVILDLMMPEVDGFQVLGHLRTNPKTAWIPVIILTGKMLSYEDVKRLDSPKVILQSKGLLTDGESVELIQQALMEVTTLPQPTSILIKQTLAHLHQNYTRALSLQELAETVGVSKSYLSRIFKLEMGISLWDYLNRFRVQRAQERLILTSDSITTVAAAVGFEDVGYFGRIFRGIIGCSPRTYRQKAGITHTTGPFRQ